MAQPSNQKFFCPHCKTVKKPQGFHNHVKACPLRGPKQVSSDYIYQQLLNEEIAASRKDQPVKMPIPLWKHKDARHDAPDIHTLSDDSSKSQISAHSPFNSTSETDAECSSLPAIYHPQKDDIRVEYHPHSRQPTRTSRFTDFKRREPVTKTPKTHSSKPWEPFKTRSDFEFAQLALESNLSRNQVDQLIKIINRCSSGQDEFSLSSNGDLRTRWAESAKLYSQFEKHIITAEYREEKMSFPFWCLDLWDWAIDLVRNKSLAPHFEWNAQKLYKYDGKEFVRFIDEPWTADEWHNFQSSLPTTGKPLCFILYADKAKLSSFGTQMGYPIIARLANLPVEMRNGKGLGGGCIVGWLPEVKIDEAGQNDSEYVDYKRAIWHKSFRVLIQKLKTRTSSGEWVTSGCDEKLHLFPYILIWSSDYEEQVVMSLTRGHSALFPCPICLVPCKSLHDLQHKYELRTQKSAMKLVQEARSKDPTTCETMLKAVSLRPVENAFWDLDNFDLFQALAFDRMHNNAHGLGGKHLWPLIQKYLKGIGKNAESLVDQRAMEVPRWRNLYHFNKVTNIQFSDASKFEDLMKIALFLVHDLLSSSQTTGIKTFLLLVRKYLNIDMYASFNVHTTKTLKDLHNEICEYNDILNEYIIETQSFSKKSWDFPKNHMLSHVIDGILAKGVTQNSSTKPSESMHGFIRNVYHQRTNFKDIAPQILEAATCYHVANLMNTNLDAEEEQDEKDISLIEESTDGSKNCPIFYQVQLGSKQKTKSLGEFENDQKQKQAFQGFIDKVIEFTKINFNEQLEHYDKITEWAFMKVKYESMVDWRLEEDYLRCSPVFHGRARHDCIIYQTEDGPSFAQLQMIFTIIMQDQAIPLCLVSTFSRQKASELDTNLEFIRLHEEHKYQIIYARSIIRGAMVLPAYDHRNDFLLFDVVDSDMFLRVRTPEFCSE